MSDLFFRQFEQIPRDFFHLAAMNKTNDISSNRNGTQKNVKKRERDRK